MIRPSILWLSLLTTLVAAQLKCYRIDGTEADSVYAPCNPNAKVSGCCAINKSNPDLCLGSGLCMSQDEGYQGFIYANGCTDKTGKDSSCPNPCPNNNWPSASVTAYNVLQCAPGSQYCCRKFGDSKNCCSSTVSFSIGSIITTATTTASTSSVFATTTGSATSTATAIVCAANGASNNTSNECPQDKSAVVGGAVGGVLGAALLASLGALVFLLLRRRKDTEPSSSSSIPTYQPEVARPPVYELPPGHKMPEMAG